MLKSIKNIFLVLSGFTLLLTIGYYLFYERGSANVDREVYVDNVQEQLKKSLENSDKELLGLNPLLPTDSNKLFRSMLPKTTYPYFIYRDNDIIHWSDNTFVPKIAQIKDGKHVQAISINGKIYVVQRHSTTNLSYRVYSLIPLIVDNELPTEFNENLFGTKPIDVSLDPSPDNNKNITSPEGDFLFSIQPPAGWSARQPLLSDTTLKLLGVTLLLLGCYCFFQIDYLRSKRQYGRSFLLLACFLFVVRWFLSLLNVQSYPQLFEPLDLTVNRWAISLGDRLLNGGIGLLLLGYLALYFYRSTVNYKIKKSGQGIKSVYSVLCVVIVFLITYLLKNELLNVLHFSDSRLNYALPLSISQHTMGLIGYYLLLSGVFFTGVHCCLHLFTQLQPNRKNGTLHWLYGTILSLIVLAIADDLQWIYMAVSLYFIVGYLFKLTRNFYVFRSQTSLYFLFAAFTFAIIGADALQKHLDKKEATTIKAISEAYFKKSDPATENWIHGIVLAISSDTGITEAIEQDVLAREKVTQRIRDNYLPTFANGYRTKIDVFEKTGKNMDILPEAMNLQEFVKRLLKTASPTHFPNLFADTKADFQSPDYYVTIPVDSNRNYKGTIVIEFLSNQVQSEDNRTLLGRNSAQSDLMTQAYSLALYDAKNQLVFAEGNYNYDNTSQLWNYPKNNPAHYLKNNYRHFSLKNKDGRTLILSLPDKSWHQRWSNLSFLFLLSVLAVSVILLYYSLNYSFRKRSQMNFTTRIQLYLNSAFLLPLLLVLLVAISVVGATLKSNQEEGFRNNTANIAATVKLLLDDVQSGRMSRAYFEQEVDNLATTTKTNFTIYNQDGSKNYGTDTFNEDPTEFSDFLLPEAWYELLENGRQQLLMDEKRNQREFVSSFINIPTSTGQQAILRIPYYNAKTQLNKHLIEVISSILNIFIILFILLLIASYFASRQLTNPLRAITHQLKKTNLDKLDEPLPLTESSDEMGVLIKAYNGMLKKLEESKSALSNSEKQTAWREMAKQVAHEIKNPLTPMKLSIQQLQRTLPNENTRYKTRIERALNSLNEQIDNISEIANSFSEFAKMPVPRSEAFDIVEVIQNTADLYTTNNNIDITLKFSEPKMMVKGDRQLMSRMLTNLIINGLQSVAIDIRPEVSINVYHNSEETYAIIEVKDNGTGIPEEIREKVFMPSFSTKVGGSGLGLAMAKRGIEHGGGNIWFETEVGAGTTFFVDLPLAR